MISGNVLGGKDVQQEDDLGGKLLVFMTMNHGPDLKFVDITFLTARNERRVKRYSNLLQNLLEVR